MDSKTSYDERTALYVQEKEIEQNIDGRTDTISLCQ
uniref:Uncharacterized protein n=1 Tax=Peronospora matthiolae TaxID=2874970 RepID=A0AAV1V7T5_9STRA